jgi:putative aldouronate transport system permease protein
MIQEKSVMHEPFPIPRRRKHIKETTGERVFNVINILIMLVIAFLSLYPIWYVFVNSFNDANDAMMGGIYWWPRMLSLENYKAVFRNATVFQAYTITVLRTLIGTVTGVLFTAIVSYGLSKPYLIFRKAYLLIGTVTMFFGGGLIPYFLVLKSLGLINNFLVYIIPAMFSFFNLLIFMSFFRELPAALEESARIDGANDFRIFFSIIFPLSMPVIATIALFNGVYHWNDYFSGVMFMTNRPDLEPIQTYLYRVIAQTSAQDIRSAAGADVVTKNLTTSTAVKLATMVITTVPIVCVYPFLQKYFIKGMLLGAIKE